MPKYIIQHDVPEWRRYDCVVEADSLPEAVEKLRAGDYKVEDEPKFVDDGMGDDQIHAIFLVGEDGLAEEVWNEFNESSDALYE